MRVTLLMVFEDGRFLPRTQHGAGAGASYVSTPWRRRTQSCHLQPPIMRPCQRLGMIQRAALSAWCAGPETPVTNRPPLQGSDAAEIEVAMLMAVPHSMLPHRRSEPDAGCHGP